MRPDGRTLLARPDLAAADLQGLAPAERYAPVQRHRCRAGAAAIREGPSLGAVQQDQLLFGESFEVLEVRGDWAWGRAARDGYVGFVAVDSLVKDCAAPTHRLSAVRSLAFAEPDKRAAVLIELSLNSLMTARREVHGWVEVEGAGWVFAGHLSPIGEVEDEVAGVAERFIGAPYLWGGRQITGIDCSGLVQQALYACGRACPRDTDQQETAVGREITAQELRRGDLVFWPGHVAVMLDSSRAVHATSHTMATVIEPCSAVTERRLGAGLEGPSAFRRPLC